MTQTRHRRSGTRGPRGFTLIEILIVIAIIGLLISMVAYAVASQSQTGRITECRARLASVSLLLESYADYMGDYPSSQLGDYGLKNDNSVNEGIEALVVAFKQSDYTGRRPEEGWLGNTDEDQDASLKLVDGSRTLLEIVDPWDNPIVYISNGDYDKEFLYRFTTDTALEDITMRAATNPLTGAPHQFDGFQLLSAGPDGEPGTDDDIANYEIELSED